jgi:hypothetical protein
VYALANVGLSPVLEFVAANADRLAVVFRGVRTVFSAVNTNTSPGAPISVVRAVVSAVRYKETTRTL